MPLPYRVEGRQSLGGGTMPVIALDFDGVICDSTNECILSSWNAWNVEKDRVDFSPEGLASIPPEFIARFRHCRGFASHAGHFLLPFISGSADAIASQDEFDNEYSRIDDERVRRFLYELRAYRLWIRKQQPEAWIDSHRPYEWVLETVRGLVFPVYIVTSKDTMSVEAILRGLAADLPIRKVFGGLRTKLAALQ